MEALNTCIIIIHGLLKTFNLVAIGKVTLNFQTYIKNFKITDRAKLGLTLKNKGA